MKRVSEVVTIDEIKSWNKCDIITIEAGTGQGKSYFIKNNLYALAKKDNKKILMLIHRTNCVNQFQMEIERDNKTDVIHIKTYQSLEYSYIRQREINLSEYQYIVCDEFHYHMQDATFNKFTDISLNMILEQTNAIRIFMSATGDNVRKYITNYKKHDVIPYSIPANYDFISNLIFFNKDETMDKFIEQAVKENKKAIFFIQSAEKAFKLYNKYKEYCLFNCSKTNSNGYYKYVDTDKINEMLINECFEELILITTTAMDTGVNIIDKDLTQIVTDIKDIGTLIQCIGRKRLQDMNDKIELYVKTINNKQLGGMSTQLRRKLERAKYLRTTSAHEYMIKYPRDYDKWNIIYNDFVEGDKGLSTLRINELIYFKCTIDGALIDMMKKEEFGYCKYLARLFGFYDADMGYQYTLIEENDDKMKLEEYLEEIVGEVMLTVANRKELIEKINVKQNGKVLKSLDILNSALREQGLDYYIKQFETSKMENGKKKNYKSAWKVMKMIDL